eukprot:127619-Heterocapsa_arctica.AAC.1
MVLYRIPPPLIRSLSKLADDLRIMSRPPLKPWTSLYTRPVSHLLAGPALASLLLALPDGGACLVRSGHSGAAWPKGRRRPDRRRDLRARPLFLPEHDQVAARLAFHEALAGVHTLPGGRSRAAGAGQGPRLGSGYVTTDEARAGIENSSDNDEEGWVTILQ